jgi:hypothetical protein
MHGSEDWRAIAGLIARSRGTATLYRSLGLKGTYCSIIYAYLPIMYCDIVGEN